MHKLMFIILLLLPGNVLAAEIYLAAAASLRELAADVANRFEKAHPEHQVYVNTAASGVLARQIEAGSPADLFLSANPEWMDYLVSKGKVTENQVIVWAANRLVVVGRGAKLDELKAVVTFSRLSIGSPESTPVGRYARSMLLAAGIYDELKNDRKLVFAKDVRQALAYADQGVVDGAVVYASDARLLHHGKTLIDPDDKLQPEIRYPLALTLTGEKSQAARELLRLLISNSGAALLKTYGFVPLFEVKE